MYVEKSRKLVKFITSFHQKSEEFFERKKKKDRISEEIGFLLTVSRLSLFWEMKGNRRIRKIA